MTDITTLMPEAATDFAALGAWMETQGLDRGPILNPVPLTGGTQNVLIRFSKGGRDFVLRRPPPSPRPESNETMRREARVLAALANSEVPHPALIAPCDDKDILGCVFYLMDPVDGFNPVAGLPPLHASDANIRHAMGLALVDGAAALGRVDYRAVGLTDFGRPEGYLARQVGRWRKQLAGYDAFAGWPGPEGLPAIDDIAEYLDRHCPQDGVPGICHGDYSIGNAMFHWDGPGLAAIVDWELATIGDPLIDLGWLLATWRRVPPVELPVFRIEPWDGFPGPDELIARYATMSGRDVSQADWYMVLACYRLAVILEGTFARAFAGKAPMETGKTLHETAVALLRRARYRIGL